MIFELPKAPPIVRLEHYRAPAFLYDPKDVTAYREAVNDIRTLTMSPEGSIKLVTGVANTMERPS